METSTKTSSTLLSSVFKMDFDVDIRSPVNVQSRDPPYIGSPQDNQSVIIHDLLDACNDMFFNRTHCRSILSEFQVPDHWFSPGVEALMVTLYCLVIIGGLIGNSIVCYIVMKFKHLQKPRNIFIFNLSVCGIIMCVACMPFSLLRLTLKNWELGSFLCRLSPSLQTIDVFVSTFTIVAIAIDRYSSIVCATRSVGGANKKAVYYCITLMWLSSIIFCLPMLTYHEVRDVIETGHVKLFKICMEVWPSDALKKVYTTSVLLFQYVLPLCIISVLHGRICQFLRLRINENPRTQREIQRVLQEVKRQQKNMLLLTAIAITFAIAWLPLTVLNTLADYDASLFMNRNFNEAYAYCLLGAMCSALMNPIIYGWFNTNFRQAFLQVLLMRRKSVDDPQELATIKNDSRGNSQQPFRFYSSLQLELPDLSGKIKRNKSRSSLRSSTRSVSPKVQSLPQPVPTN